MLPIGPFHSAKILKEFLGPIQSFEDVPFFGSKWPICHQKKLVQTIIIIFFYLLALFIEQNLKKVLHWIQSFEHGPFLGPKWSICPKKIFFGKLLISHSSTYQPLSLCKVLNKLFQQIQSYGYAQFLGPKWFISPNENFFEKNLLMSLVSFIHAYLHAKNRSQISIYQ